LINIDVQMNQNQKYTFTNTVNGWMDNSYCITDIRHWI